MVESASAPVITIDGPTASGKGTITRRVAQALGWHALDSGALYRLTALAAIRRQVPLDDEARLGALARSLAVRFEGDSVCLDGEEVTDAIRAEAVGLAASQVAVLAAVRAGLLERQRGFCQPPGLVADGRDMGSVVFPDAPLKVFLTASAEARAERRLKQLKDKGISANFDSLLQDLRARDQRDSSRANAPLVAAQGSYLIDSSGLDVDQTVSAVLDRWIRVSGEKN